MARELKLPDPVVERHGRFAVVREDRLVGGTKTRFLPTLIGDAEEVVFGGPFCGGAPLALAAVGRALGRRVTLFYARRASLHPRQRLARELGARLEFVSPGYMTVVQARARAYAAGVGALFLPLGFDRPEADSAFRGAILAAREAAGPVDEVWCASGSGMLLRNLARAFPELPCFGVTVGLASRWSEQQLPANASFRSCPWKFEQPCREPAPFDSCPNYDRKAWVRMLELARPSARCLFWNVLGDSSRQLRT